MHAAAGIALAAAGLLVAAGWAKVVHPGPAADALRSVGLPVGSGVMRAGAIVEAGVGIGALVAGGPAWGLVTIWYAGFTAFLAVALSRRGRVRSCGCAGRADTPPTAAHLVVTVFLGAAAAIAAADGASGLASAWQPWSAETLPLLGFSALVGWLGWLVLTVLPRLRNSAGLSRG